MKNMTNPWDLPARVNPKSRKPISCQEQYGNRLRNNYLKFKRNSSCIPQSGTSEGVKEKGKSSRISQTSVSLNTVSKTNASIAIQKSKLLQNPTSFQVIGDSLFHRTQYLDDSGNNNVAMPPIPNTVETSAYSRRYTMPKCGSLLNVSTKIFNRVSSVDNTGFDTTTTTTTSVDVKSPNNNILDTESIQQSDTYDDIPSSNFELDLQVPHESTSKRNSSKSTNIQYTQNYVKLNLRKKVYSRKGSMRQRILKRKVYAAKIRKKFGTNNYKKGGSVCFKCGVTGHWANKCPATIAQGQDRSVLDHSSHHQQRIRTATYRLLDPMELDARYLQPHTTDVFLNMRVAAKTLFESQPISKITDQIHAYLKQMGFDHFRPGQELVILRTVLGVSTLVIMPTAAGKSLCYQIPALVHQKIHGTVALIISPLISLMQDQIVHLYGDVKGAYLNSNQTIEAKNQTLSDVKSGKYAFLIVSPEAIVESDWLLQPGRLPGLSFVCIDEAHCLADWSHHFRPSYLRVCNLVHKYLGVTCFLGLSATCTSDAVHNICKNLGIVNPIKLCEGDLNKTNLSLPGFVEPHDGPLPTHLTITASMDANRDEALLSLLSRPPFNKIAGGILIYCATRDQTERLASFIRTAFQDVVDQVGRRRLKWTTSSYHAGQTSNERTRVQKKFMSGQIRVLCATSAFGMGLNKSDLQVVIHYSMTKSFENYVQEIGRVGRKEQKSYCHTFLPTNFTTDPLEANELRRHIFSNHIDTVMLKRFVSILFDQFQCSCRISGMPTDAPNGTCSGHIHTIDPQVFSEQLDIKTESLATLLAYMELDPGGSLFSILQSGYTLATVDCYGGPQEMAYASQRCLAVAGALSIRRNLLESVKSTRQIKVDLAQLYNRWGWKPNTVKQELKNLEWDTNHMTNQVYRTGITVSFSNWKLWLWINGSQLPITNERLDNVVHYLNRRLKLIESTALESLEHLTHTLSTIAEPSIDGLYSKSYSKCPELVDLKLTVDREQRSSIAHELIRAHFKKTQPVLSSEMQTLYDTRRVQYQWPSPITENQILSLQASIREFIYVHAAQLENQITGRTLANIFHGISTPQFPATTWSKCRRYWRAHQNIDWPQIQKVATQELLKSFASL